MGGPCVDRETAKPLPVLCLSVPIPQALGASPRTALVFLLLAGLHCLAWWGFILWHWWAVVHRYSDRSYHLVTKKRLSANIASSLRPMTVIGSDEGGQVDAPAPDFAPAFLTRKGDEKGIVSIEDAGEDECAQAGGVSAGA